MLVVERKYKIANSVSNINPSLSVHRSSVLLELLSSCNNKYSGSAHRYLFASIYSSSPLLYSFALQCCCNMVKMNRSQKLRSIYGDSEEQSALRVAPNTSVFSLQNAVLHYPSGGGDS